VNFSLSVPTQVEAVVLVAALIAAVTDLTRFKIYNLLTLPLLAGGLVYHGTTGGPQALAMSVGGMLLGAAVLLVFYVMGGMGAGDVKLMAALGAWLGLPDVFYLFLASALAAGVYALVLMVAYGSTREVVVNLQIIWHRVATVARHLGSEDQVESEVRHPDRRRRLIPFAAMIAVGLIALVLMSWLMGGRP
jgi:prepilin peptidase CpaA